MVRFVVFDAVGTLITPDPPAGDVYHRVGRRYGSKRSVEEVRQRFRQEFRGRAYHERSSNPNGHRTSERQERSFWESLVSKIFEELPATVRRDCFHELFEHFGQPVAWRVYSDVESTLTELRRRGIPVAVASNFDGRLHRVFAGHAELAGIDARFVSSEIGWRKPDPRFFAVVCGRLKCRSAEVLYVGDEPFVDVVAASKAGLSSLLLRREGPESPGVIANLSRLFDDALLIPDPTQTGSAT